MADTSMNFGTITIWINSASASACAQSSFFGVVFSHLGSSLFSKPDLCGPVVVLAPLWGVEWSVWPSPDPDVPVSEGTWVCSVRPLPDTWGSSLFAVSVWCGPPWIISSWRPWWPWRLPSNIWLAAIQSWETGSLSSTHPNRYRRGDRLYWPDLKSEDQRCDAFQ